MSRQLEVSSAYARMTLQAELLPAERALRGTGLTEADLASEEFFPWQSLARLYRNVADEVEQADWGPMLGAQLNVAAHGPLGFAALSAPTLGEALEVMGTLYPVRLNTISVATEVFDNRFFVYFDDLTNDGDYFRWISEVILKVLETMISSILGHPVSDNSIVTFAHSAPPGADDIRRAYDSHVEFGSERSSISIPSSWCDLPSPLYDEAVYRANIIRCREVIASREHQHSAVAAVRNILNNHFDRMLLADATLSAPPTLERVADAMHLTSRTLIRRLLAEDSSFKEILQDMRQTRAQMLLRDARYHVNEVAELLGYREPANFSRAFKRWFGVSPAAWRRQR